MIVKGHDREGHRMKAKGDVCIMLLACGNHGRVSSKNRGAGKLRSWLGNSTLWRSGRRQDHHAVSDVSSLERDDDCPEAELNESGCSENGESQSAQAMKWLATSVRFHGRQDSGPTTSDVPSITVLSSCICCSRSFPQRAQVHFLTIIMKNDFKKRARCAEYPQPRLDCWQ